jgi:predicted ATP-grasp superfamily ATP-dependent carboligase
LPHYYGPATESTAARNDIRYPVVVKPAFSHRFFLKYGVKLFTAQNRQELMNCCRAFSKAGLKGLVFELIPGPDSRIYTYSTYIDARGEPKAGVVVRKLRQSPPFFGVARVAEIAEDRGGVMKEMTLEILRRTGFRGIAVAEFKYDSRDGSIRFLEFNGRSVIYNSILQAAGTDLPWLAWSDQVLGNSVCARGTSWRGVWINLHADILYSTIFSSYESFSPSEYIYPYRRPKTYGVWSRRDPAPFFAQWLNTAQEAGLSFRHGKLGAFLKKRARHRPA